MIFNISSNHSVKVKIGQDSYLINKGSQKVNVPDAQANVFKERLKVYGLVFSTENEKVTVDNYDKATKKALFTQAKELGLKPEFNATVEQLKAMIEEFNESQKAPDDNSADKKSDIIDADNGNQGNS